MKRPYLLLLAALAATAALQACTAHYSLTDFDALARTGPARTIVLEEGFSLYSPYDVHTTREYVPLITEQQAEVFALFGVASPTPIVVHLREDEGIGADVTVVGEQLRLDGLSMAPDDGVLGWAGEEVVVRVAPVRPLRLADGRELKGVLAASMYMSTLRHELSHVATRLAGLRPAPWLGEGLAHAVEWIPLEAGRFVLDPVPPSLARAASLAREPDELERLLAWQQAYPATDADRRARLLGHALAVFLIEREPGPLSAALEGVTGLDREQILALEPDWAAWLDDLGRRAEAADADDDA